MSRLKNTLSDKIKNVLVRIMQSIFPFILIYFRLVQPDSSTTVNWNTQDGEKIPTVEIGFKGEIFTIPLREAPFCHLWVINKCECFVVRRDADNTQWTIASFAYCDGTIEGYFTNSTSSFEVAPIENGQYNVTEFATETNETGELTDDLYILPGMPNITIGSHYFRPIAGPGLRDYETGFIPCWFVVDSSVYVFESPRRMDRFLQGLINDANEYLSQFNLIAVFRGWEQAMKEDTRLITIDDGGKFLATGYLKYVKKGIHNLIILLSPSLPHGKLEYIFSIKLIKFYQILLSSQA